MAAKNQELKACDFDALSNVTGNAYESVLSVGKRSRKIAENQKLDFLTELEDLNIREDGNNSLVDTDIQGIVSKRYEVRKPLIEALKEFMEGKLVITYKEV